MAPLFGANGLLALYGVLFLCLATLSLVFAPISISAIQRAVASEDGNTVLFKKPHPKFVATDIYGSLQ